VVPPSFRPLLWQLLIHQGFGEIGSCNLGASQIPTCISPPSDRGVHLVLRVEDLSGVLDCFLVRQTHLSTLLLLFVIGETSYLIA
jgi:hypothetical protein